MLCYVLFCCLSARQLWQESAAKSKLFTLLASVETKAQQTSHSQCSRASLVGAALSLSISLLRNTALNQSKLRQFASRKRCGLVCIVVVVIVVVAAAAVSSAIKLIEFGTDLRVRDLAAATTTTLALALVRVCVCVALTYLPLLAANRKR